MKRPSLVSVAHYAKMDKDLNNIFFFKIKDGHCEYLLLLPFFFCSKCHNLTERPTLMHYIVVSQYL